MTPETEQDLRRRVAALVDEVMRAKAYALNWRARYERLERLVREVNAPKPGASQWFTTLRREHIDLRQVSWVFDPVVGPPVVHFFGGGRVGLEEGDIAPFRRALFAYFGEKLVPYWGHGPGGMMAAYNWGNEVGGTG